MKGNHLCMTLGMLLIITNVNSLIISKTEIKQKDTPTNSNKTALSLNIKDINSQINQIQKRLLSTKVYFSL